MMIKVREAAKILDVTPSRVRQLIASGDLTASRTTPRKIKVDKSSVDALIKRSNAQ